MGEYFIQKFWNPGRAFLKKTFPSSYNKIEKDTDNLETIDHLKELRKQADVLVLSWENPDAYTNFGKVLQSYQKNNISKVLAYGAKGELPLTMENIDTDWFATFVDKTKNISKEELQVIRWSILMQEVKNPGHISFRALDVLSKLSMHEAQLFERIANYILATGLIFGSQESSNFSHLWLKYSDLIALEECGLLNWNFWLVLKEKDAKIGTIVYWEYTIVFEKTNKEQFDLEIPVIKLTNEWRELWSAIYASPKTETTYLEYIKQWFKDNGFEVNAIKK